MSKKVIDANHRSIVPDFKELFRYKDLFLTLAWRDFRGSICTNNHWFAVGGFATRCDDSYFIHDFWKICGLK